LKFWEIMFELQKFEKSDFDRLISWMPDEQFLIQTCGPLFKWPLDSEQLERHLKDAEGEKPTVYTFKVVHVQSNKIIGHVEIIWIDYEKSNGMLGPILIGDPKLRGKGYGREVAKLAVEFGFNNIGLNEIYLWVFEFNIAAIRCYEKIGFKKYDLKKSALTLGNKSCSSMKMKLSKKDYSIDSFRWKDNE
jgi:RimJ/RimL family protein N-acetyltransferase